MRYRSNKRARLMRQVKQQREDFAAEFRHCWACGSGYQVWIHEILRGGGRETALEHRSCWLAACWHCNSGVLNDAKIYPIARQLALKYLHDLEYFDREEFCRLKREGPRAYTMAEIIPWICREQDDGVT